ICNRLAICRNRREILPTVSFIRCETSFLHWKGNGVATKLWRKAPFGNSGTMNWEKAVPGKVIQLQLSSGTSRVTSIRDSRIFSAPTARSLGGIASPSFSRTRVFHVPNYWNDGTADGEHSSPP